MWSPQNFHFDTIFGIKRLVTQINRIAYKRSILVFLLKSEKNLPRNRILPKSVYAQELEVRSLNRPYSLKIKSSQCHYVVMTRSETKLSVAIPAPVSGQSAVNVATATSKCSITFLLPYDQDGDVRQNRTMSQIYFKSIYIVPDNLFVRA